MAIDTAEKRRTASGGHLYSSGPPVTPNSDQDEEWRHQVGYVYFLAAVAPPAPVDSIGAGGAGGGAGPDVARRPTFSFRPVPDDEALPKLPTEVLASARFSAVGRMRARGIVLVPTEGSARFGLKGYLRAAPAAVLLASAHFTSSSSFRVHLTTLPVFAIVVGKASMDRGPKAPVVVGSVSMGARTRDRGRKSESERENLWLLGLGPKP